MSSWVCVNTDFDGEETAHFGPRKESGTSLYQVDTLATISSQETNTENPNVVSAVLGDYGCLSVCKDLSIFQDIQYSVTLSFDDVIDTLEWSPNGRLLAVGTKDGKLYLVETEKNQIYLGFPVISEENMVGEAAFKRILFQQRQNERSKCDVYILSTGGVVSVMKHLDQSVFTTKGVENPGQVLQNQMKCDKIITYDYHTVSTTAILSSKSTLYTFGIGDSIICKWSCKDDQIELVDEIEGCFGEGTGIVLAKMSSDGKYLFTVDQDGVLTLWHSYDLTVLTTWSDMFVTDFQLLETMELKNNSTKEMKLLVLSQNNDGSTLYVQELPMLNTVYTLQLNKETYIASCPSFQESLYVVECCCEDNFPDIISTVRFRCLTEAKPETRLSRLLNKKLFDQAEEFAKTFKMDLELVYEVKVHHILEQVAPWNCHNHDTTFIDDMIKDLWVCLDLIKNDLNVAYCCLKVALPTYEETCKLLQYIKTRLIKLASTKPPPETLQRQQLLLAEVLEIQHRMLTYRMIYGVDQYRPEDWDSFMKTNLLEKSLMALSTHQPNITFTIWQRHKFEWKKYMDVSVINQLLRKIPETVDANQLQGWFRDDLIPYISTDVPLAMQSLVSWILSKIGYMELLEKKDWPLNALQFGKCLYEKINEVLQINLSDTISPADNAAKTQINSKIVIQPLHDMVVDLQHLYNLEVKNSCRLSLAQFQQETTESVTFRMLDQIMAVELIVPALQRQIIPYLQEHELNEDYILARYVKDLLERTGHIRTIMGTSLWESKTEAIIGFIRDKQEKCLAILDIMKIAPLPWSEEVEKLIQSGLKLDHPMVAELREQCRLVEVKKLMIKYGLNNIMDVPSTDMAERLVSYILRKDMPSAIEDALQIYKGLELTNVVDIYKIRSSFLIKNKRISEYVELLMSLSTHLAISTGEHVVNKAVLQLEDAISRNKMSQVSKEYKIVYTEAAIATTNHLQAIVRDSHEKEEWKILQVVFHNILFLQVEFGLYITLDQYKDVSYREKILMSYEEQFFTSSTSFNTEQSSTVNYHDICRLADLLMISRVQFQSRLAIHAARKADITTAVKHCSKLFENEISEEEVEAMLLVCRAFIQILSDCDIDVDEMRCLPQTTYQLACQTLTYCSSDSDVMCDCVAMCEATHLLYNVNNECEASSLSGIIPKNQRKTSVSGLSKDDRFKTWSFDVVFKEDSLVMNSSIVLLLVANFLKVNPFLKIDFGEKVIHKVEICFNASILLIQHLKENSHFELTLRTVMYVISMATKLYNMGYVKETEDIAIYKKQLEKVEQKTSLLIKELLKGILSKLFNCNKVDHKLALACVLCIPQNLCGEALKTMFHSAGHNYKKLMAVSTVGIAVGEIFNDASAIQFYEKFEVNGRWGYRLGKFKIQFKAALSGGPNEKLKILTQMAHSEAADVKIIKEFCTAFNLQRNDGLLMYLENVLTKDNSIWTTQDANKLRSRLAIASEIIEAIKEKGILRKKLKQMLQMTSVYDYDSIEFILKALNKLDTDPHVLQGLALIPYLKVYKRHGTPSQEEMSYGLNKDGEEELSTILGTIPEIGKTRIPYHPLIEGDAWKIITPELDSDTVSIWLPIAHILKLKVDEVYLIAVQNMVKKHVACQKSELSKQDGSDKTKCNWSFNNRSIRFLDSIQELLMKVSDISLVLACSNWLVRQLPMGGEKILGLKCCVGFAEKWNLACSDDDPNKKKAIAAYMKFSTFFKKLSTERILFSHNISESHIIQLVGQPIELINKLYELPCITADQLDISIKRPDINGMVNDIIEIQGLQKSKILGALMEKWLPSSASKQDADATCTFSFNNFSLTDQGVEMDDDDANLKRVLYLLQKDSVEDNAVYLFNYATAHSNTTNLCKTRALLCLLKIVDNKTMEDKLQKSVKEIRHMLRIFSYLVDLEELHIQHSVKTFEECNKDGLVRGIWKNHNHQKTGILLTCALCLDYNIHDADLWNGVLKQLLSLSSLKHLEYVLVRLSAHANIWLVGNFTKAWQHLLTSPLTKVSTPLDNGKLEECLHYFNLLHKCPVTSSLNLSQLSHQYLNLGLFICAAGCLLLSTMSHTNDVQEILDGSKIEHFKSLDSLIKLGITNIAVNQVREALFSLILEDEDYSTVVDTPEEKLFVLYCIKKNQINGLLVFALRNKRIQEAERLFQLYLQDNTCLKNDIIDNMLSDGTNSELEAYLKMQGITG